MKKIILGLGVLIIYAIYSIGVRHQHPVIAKPSSLNNNVASNTNSGTQSTTSNTGSSSSSTASSNASSSGSSTTTSSGYKDGTYQGNSVNVYYGNVQVSVDISGGRISNVKFLQYPNTHAASVYINQQAMPYLVQEAIQAQSYHVQIISGATFTSEGFQQSLQSALSKA